MEKNIISLIPARGGSKSIPQKNIRLLEGVPLLAYSIAASLQASKVYRTIVSTDSEEIAEQARAWGAEVPFIRPAQLAEDHTLDYPVFEHALRWLEQEEDYRAAIVVQLRPTSPFRPPGSVDEAIELLRRTGADSVRTVIPSGQNPYKMWRIEKDRMEPLLGDEFKEPYNMPRQKLPQTYWQTGHIDVMRYETIMDMRSMTGQHIAPYIVDPSYAIDLDTERDWRMAEYIIKHWDLNIVKPQRDTSNKL